MAAVGVGGAGLGVWLAGVPTARVILPGGELGYLHGPVRLSQLLLAAAAGVAMTGVAWVMVARGTAGGEPWPDRLRAAAGAMLPLLLLWVDGLRVLVPFPPPLAWGTNPAVVLAYEARWVVAGVVAFALVASTGRLLAAGRRDPRGLALALPVPVGGVPVFCAALVLYLAFLPRALLVAPTGDEPDYLVLAESLLVDRDFDLANNVARADGPFHVRPGPRGGVYSAHRLGLPLVVLPAYGLGRLLGVPERSAVVVLLCLVAALLVARTATWVAALTGDRWGASLAALAVGASAPLLFYAYAMYPELPVALLVLEACRRLAGPSPRVGWTVGWLLAALPWFHEKFAPAALTSLVK